MVGCQDYNFLIPRHVPDKESFKACRELALELVNETIYYFLCCPYCTVDTVLIGDAFSTGGCVQLI